MGKQFSAESTTSAGLRSFSKAMTKLVEPASLSLFFVPAALLGKPDTCMQTVSTSRTRSLQKGTGAIHARKGRLPHVDPVAANRHCRASLLISTEY
ncbi:hypothetical protein [Paraburkholderia azotifigens]|uniref:Uncharacterized protein n=1 Tax=Paraburkholderia azotifigens TaxID=2057004 RepID=A0ABU9R0B7_9BURK|nr:hypothetical protein [Paraburkholderia azotifigens]